MKVITTKNEEITTEHHGKSFNEVYSEHKGKDIDMFLNRYDESKTGIGHVFVKECKIGNCLDSLTKTDYYFAYDKIF